MADEKCPGCNEPFAERDIAGVLPDPWHHSGDGAKRLWHLRCHQDAYFSDLRRDRRTKQQRMIDDLWKR